jgi:hypothetical protein
MKNIHRSSSREFNQTSIFSTEFETTQISNFIKIRLVAAEIFHAGGQTDVTKTSLFAIIQKRLKWQVSLTNRIEWNMLSVTQYSLWFCKSGL